MPASFPNRRSVSAHFSASRKCRACSGAAWRLCLISYAAQPGGAALPFQSAGGRREGRRGRARRCADRHSTGGSSPASASLGHSRTGTAGRAGHNVGLECRHLPHHPSASPEIAVLSSISQPGLQVERNSPDNCLSAWLGLMHLCYKRVILAKILGGSNSGSFLHTVVLSIIRL